ncbi:hypothetical protein BS333_13750 [Vibrio azureus]|uniref:Pili assembly chaperone N-terminal domain-containing protein n=1 Tax=Vibrio azureus NBRC 104587 TaxID=1219077 RepID=U3CG62_9VIBR|nr:hypothetical protein [Vibrio azureus]AUI87482.1 hypothetical protein BS333_13750 [Vibrio azureus]GAD77278.1 hypothetical protein VAZ01S_069_00260 [Vibrio azureus NBRC 104587]
MIKHKLSQVIIFLLLSISFGSTALEINSMMLVSAYDDESVFTIKNNENARIFVSTSISELFIKNGEIEMVDYNRNNIFDWRINLSPRKTIIEPGRKKDFFITLSDTNLDPKSNNIDRAFQISFIPQAYVSEGMEKTNHVNFTIGLGPLFILAGEEQPINYDIKYDGKILYIHNKGNSFIRANLDSCKYIKSEGTDCTQEFVVLAGRKLNVNLKEGLMSDDILVNLETHRAKYRESITIHKGHNI